MSLRCSLGSQGNVPRCEALLLSAALASCCHGSSEDLHIEDEAGEENQAEQALAPVVPPEDWHQDPLQQIPTSLAPWQDRLLNRLMDGASMAENSEITDHDKTGGGCRDSENAGAAPCRDTEPFRPPTLPTLRLGPVAV
eukprot:s4580_g3.t1